MLSNSKLHRSAILLLIACSLGVASGALLLINQPSDEMVAIRNNLSSVLRHFNNIIEITNSGGEGEIAKKIFDDEKWYLGIDLNFGGDRERLDQFLVSNKPKLHSELLIIRSEMDDWLTRNKNAQVTNVERREIEKLKDKKLKIKNILSGLTSKIGPFSTWIQNISTYTMILADVFGIWLVVSTLINRGDGD